MGKEKYVLVVDVGNTHTVVGLFFNDRIVRTFRFASRHPMTADECYLLINPAITESEVQLPFDGSAICSVVPQLTGAYESAFKRLSLSPPVIVSGTLSTGIQIKVKRPEQVGADRIANSVAAHMYYGGDIVVVDLGTATTFDVVSREGEYLGGAIASGIFTSAQRLFEKAAMLPKMDISLPETVIGKTTEEAIRSGIYYGAVSQIDGITERIMEEWGRVGDVIATGGYARLVAEKSRTITKVDTELTLKGIIEIWKIQRHDTNI
ncbi:MAG: type III pantothenate kinase [Candidatus Glassbacteria bacterium]